MTLKLNWEHHVEAKYSFRKFMEKVVPLKRTMSKGPC